MPPCECSVREGCVYFLVGSVGQLSAESHLGADHIKVAKQVQEPGKWHWGHRAALWVCTGCSAEQGEPARAALSKMRFLELKEI